MWFVFGFITLAGFCIYNAYAKINAAWEGTSSEVKGHDYQYRLVTHKDEITRILIGVDAPEGLDFGLKKEGSLDRLFKKIGISTEHQVGNSKFDDLVYIVSDNSSLHQHISHNEELVSSILALFSEGATYSRNLNEVRCNSGRIWLNLSAPLGFKESDLGNIAEKVVPIIKVIAEQLSKIDAQAIKKWRDPFVIKAAIILASSSGLAINGLVQSFRIDWIDIPFTIDYQHLMIEAAYWGAGIVLLLLLIALFLLGKSSRTHIVLLEVLLFGSFGAFLTTHAQMRDLNIEMDESSGYVYYVTTHDKRKSKTRRSTSYYLSVDDWNASSNSWKEIEVGSQLFNDVRKGDTLHIVQKDGYLNYRWVESVENMGANF